MTYKYFAFISYSSQDVTWGRKLQTQLERYRLPSRLRKRHRDTPARAYPVFRDETDLSGFQVRPALERELSIRRASHHLLFFSPIILKEMNLWQNPAFPL